MSDDAQLETSTEVDVTATMAILDNAIDELPVDQIRTVQRNRERFIPHLIEAIRAATAVVREGDYPSGMAHDFALILLTEFRAKEALPAILEAIALPGDGPYVMFNDTITEYLPTTLAALADDKLELLEGLIRDRSLDEFVRWSVANAVSALALRGAITREEAAERLGRLCRHAIDTQDHELAIPLISNLGDLGVAASRQLALEAFDKLEFDPNYSTREQIDEDFDAAARGAPLLFERDDSPEPRETVAYMSSWSTFADPDTALFHHDDDIAEESEDYDETEDSYEVPQPIHAPPKVGRNESCPCGSGKKYKKCCGRGGEGLRLTP